MTATIRRRRWPLFFEPRRRFKKRIMRIMRTVMARLRYLAEAAVAVARGQAVKVVLTYTAELTASVKRAGRRVRLTYFMGPVRAFIKRAGRAARLVYSALSRVSVIKRLRLVPRVDYTAWGPNVWTAARQAPLPRLDYWAYDPYAEVEKSARHSPSMPYWTSVIATVAARMPEVVVWFINRNDPHFRWFIVCIDKDWGTPECNSRQFDWGVERRIRMGGFLISPPFKFSKKLMAVVVTSPLYAYTVEFRTQRGALIKRCDFVDGARPCYLHIEELMRFAGVT